MKNELGQPVGVDVVIAPAAPPSRSTMIGNYCRLESLDASTHAAALHAEYVAAADAADWTYLPYGPYGNEETFVQWVASVQDKDDPVFFAVVDIATDAAVGVASYLRIDEYAASIEVGHIHFSRAMQKTPAATEAMYLMMRRAFDGGYRRYEWKCDALNAPSRAAAERLGFQYEGTFRQATHYKGRNRDTAWFGIIDDDWPALQAGFERWLDPSNFDSTGTQRSALRTG